MPEIPARGTFARASDEGRGSNGDKRQTDSDDHGDDSSRDMTTPRSDPKKDGVLPGVRTVSSPPGEPYNDPEYGRS